MKRALILVAVMLVACEAPLEWDEVRCADGLCFGRLDDGWVRAVDVDQLELEVQSTEPPSCEPTTGFDEIRCVVAGDGQRCFTGDGQWFAPFDCDVEVGELGWSANVCGGMASVDGGPWDEVGCTAGESVCKASIGDATFDIWPDCYMADVL